MLTYRCSLCVTNNDIFTAHNADANKSKKIEPVANEKINGVSENGENGDLDTSKFASETKESEQESLAAYNEATASLNLSQDIESETPPTTTSTKENGIHEEQREEKETQENGRS